MSQINYLDIIKKAWEIAWKNKCLWWFGLLVALISISGYLNYIFPNSFEDIPATQEKILRFADQHLALIIISVIAIFIFFIVIGILGVFGRGALIKLVHATAKMKPSNFKIGLAEGKKYFWRLLTLELFLGIFLFIILAIISVPIIFLFINQSYILGAILAIVGALLFIPLIVLSFFLRAYGQLYIVLGGISLRSAIENAYALFLKNLSISVIMFLLLMIADIIFSFIVMLVSISIGIVFSILEFVVHSILKNTEATVFVGLGIFTGIILFLVLRAIYETFLQTVWVLFFHEIATPKESATATEIILEKNPISKATPDPITFQKK